MISSTFRQLAAMFTFLALLGCGCGVEEEDIIYPRNGLDQQMVTSLHRDIISLAIKEHEVYASQCDPSIPPVFWLALLTVEGSQTLKQHQFVSRSFLRNLCTIDRQQVEDIEPNVVAGGPAGLSEPLSAPLQAATASYSTQSMPSATELRVTSQPSGDPNLDSYRDYVYESDAGKDTFIYHAEVGINAEHDDFRDRKVEWIFTALAVRAGKDTRNESANFVPGHSTCTAF